MESQGGLQGDSGLTVLVRLGCSTYTLNPNKPYRVQGLGLRALNPSFAEICGWFQPAGLGFRVEGFLLKSDL